MISALLAGKVCKAVIDPSKFWFARQMFDELPVWGHCVCGNRQKVLDNFNRVFQYSAFYFSAMLLDNLAAIVLITLSFLCFFTSQS
jgi:hypothetical protein